jgi:large subunit ribosomal protein L21
VKPLSFHVVYQSEPDSQPGARVRRLAAERTLPRRTDVYAIIRDRGMQYRVEKGQVLTIDLIETAEAGSTIELGEVLLVGDGDSVKVGSPLVNGASVRAEVLREAKGDKIVVFRYRNKKRYRRRTGHRQRYTEIKISDILV